MGLSHVQVKELFQFVIGIIWSNGESWRDLRKYTVKNLREFGFGKVKSMQVMIQEEVGDMMDFLKDTSRENRGIMEMNPHDYAGSVVNILWSMVAGYKFPIGDKTIHAILEHGNRISEVTSQGNIYNAFPELRKWFPKLTNWDKHMESHTEYQQFVKVCYAHYVELKKYSHKYDCESRCIPNG